MDPEHVDLVDVPPVGRVGLPGRSPRAHDAGIRDEQVHLPCVGDRTLDRMAVGDVHLHPPPTDLLRNGLHLLAAACTHDDIPAIARERLRDPSADAAPTTGDEGPHARQLIRRSEML
jgi:hypothetical protein